MFPVPEISISYASPEETVSEPFSPFLQLSKDAGTPQNDDPFRPALLSPPIVLSPKRLSPLRPAESPTKGQGLERDRFEALLKACRDRNGMIGTRREVDLRKEIAIKVHKNKQGTHCVECSCCDILT